MVRMSWTQAVCDKCWVKQEGDRRPTRLKSAMVETCSYCGHPTASGIYKRDDPKSVAYPQMRED
jgi:hypothetical protein